MNLVKQKRGPAFTLNTSLCGRIFPSKVWWTLFTSSVPKSLDFCRNSNTWHFVKRRKMALKFYTFKWRFLHFLHSYEQCWYVKLPQILCSFEIITWNFHFTAEIIEKIKENVKLLRLVKITTLTTVQDLTFKQQLQTLIRSLKVINLVIWWQNLKDNAQIY